MIREAWCKFCGGPSACDESGCIKCREGVTLVDLAKARARARALDKRLVRNSECSRARRARLRGAKLCINGATHGLATHGCRCGWCSDVHKRGINRVIESPKFPRPPRGRVVGRRS